MGKNSRFAGLTVEVHKLEGRTPVILMELPGTGPGNDTALALRALEEATRDERAGGRPVAVDAGGDGDRLYGGGGADDGYRSFVSIAALRMLTEQVPHARRRPHRGGRGERQPRIARVRRKPSPPASASRRSSSASTRGRELDQLWSTTSLRGGVLGHPSSRHPDRRRPAPAPPAASCPTRSASSGRILSRIEDEKTGQVLLDALHLSRFPPACRAQAHASAEILKDEVQSRFRGSRTPVRATSRLASSCSTVPGARGSSRSWGLKGLPEPHSPTIACDPSPR